MTGRWFPALDRSWPYSVVAESTQPGGAWGVPSDHLPEHRLQADDGSVGDHPNQACQSDSAGGAESRAERAAWK